MISFESSQPLKIVVLASGAGTLLQSILDNQGLYHVVGVVCDITCPALSRSEKAGIPSSIVPLGMNRDQWNADLAVTIAQYEPDLIVSAGFMKILGAPFLDHYAGRTINTHPALLPAFPGAHAVRDALDYGVKITGSTVHFIDEGVDTGEIIAQEPVAVLSGDSEAELHERIKDVERRLIVDVLNSFARKFREDQHTERFSSIHE
ncbi:phosphoribosylglycinamide formyltransferase [Corynebacterium sp. ES2794-CONJ1]|nr:MULTISPECIES: phosphoribosylglycinamide formyltransferase [unclassified Corynebacterium]MCS4490029.1 phosphoribosylglycinamide formyltransferase [Corynebacterium sp. ES2775-CONJ]MCS4491609.1 phosphoribosylglycinamide formyltransferase [Corynebacterium sp. ES2715-CONJ3]MCS4531713.1 phosphoribosylglycinamide formyltransferase [Corynebacterium sp. ES2730-CONJ]MCU9519109.1 phosphoribosylglycinamide formyltransferase [Corynebacterium sp. ES2794-CONJ1]